MRWNMVIKCTISVCIRRHHASASLSMPVGGGRSVLAAQMRWLSAILPILMKPTQNPWPIASCLNRLQITCYSIDYSLCSFQGGSPSQNYFGKVRQVFVHNITFTLLL